MRPLADALSPYIGSGAACGDVVSAHAGADALLGPAGRGTPTRRLARSFLTAAILDVAGRLEAPTLRDVRRLIALIGRPDARPFADSTMQYLQFIDADLVDLDPVCRQEAAALCLQALGSNVLEIR